MTRPPACLRCGHPVELLDMLDICPPIPYSHWPARWSVDNGEGGNLNYCPDCDADFDEETVADIAEASGRERSYPPSPETAARAAQIAYEEAHADKPAEPECPECGQTPMGSACYHICPNSTHYYSPEQERADEPFYGDDDVRERYASSAVDPAHEQYCADMADAERAEAEPALGGATDSAPFGGDAGTGDCRTDACPSAGNAPYGYCDTHYETYLDWR